MAFLACCVRNNSVVKGRPPARFTSVDTAAVEEEKDSNAKNEHLSQEALSQEGFFDAAENGDEAEISRYIDMGFDMNVVDPEDGYTCLLLAAECGQLNIVERLLKEADIDLELRDSFGRTALYAAAVANRAEIVYALLQKGADPNKDDDDGRTPFWAACALRHLEVAHILLDRIDINAKDNSGQTPLDHAAEAGHADVMNFLKEHGAIEATGRLTMVAPPPT